MMECAFLNDIFRRKRQNGVGNNVNSQIQNNSGPSGTEVLNTANLNEDSETVFIVQSSASTQLLSANNESINHLKDNDLLTPKIEYVDEYVDNFQEDMS